MQFLVQNQEKVAYYKIKDFIDNPIKILGHNLQTSIGHISALTQRVLLIPVAF